MGARDAECMARCRPKLANREVCAVRIGVVGPMGPDYFAENVGDALHRIGHLVTQLGPAHDLPEGESGIEEFRRYEIRRAAIDAKVLHLRHGTFPDWFHVSAFHG